MQEKKCVDF